jgi:hypothetical protein
MGYYIYKKIVKELHTVVEDTYFWLVKVIPALFATDL